MDSILTSIKKLLGLDEFYEHFDADIIMHINSVFMILSQIGVGPVEGFSIVDKNSKWSDFAAVSNVSNIEAVKSYIYLKVRLLFDPPTSGIVMESISSTIKELEYRLNVQYETNM